MSSAYGLTGFCCGDRDLDEFIVDDAERIHSERAARIYLATTDDKAVGYIALIADTLILDTREKKRLGFRYGDPIHMPAVKVGRLAVAKSLHCRGIGKRLMRLAFYIAHDTSEKIGCRLLTLDALPSAAPYYERLGFVRNRAEGKRREEERKQGRRHDYTVSMRLDLRAPAMPAWATPDPSL